MLWVDTFFALHMECCSAPWICDYGEGCTLGGMRCNQWFGARVLCLCEGRSNLLCSWLGGSVRTLQAVPKFFPA